MKTFEDLYERARKRYRKNDFVAAESLLLQCSELRPDHPGVLYRLGEIDRQSGKLEAALSLFDRIRALDPQFKNIGLKCAQLQMELGRLTAALESVQQHLRLIPDHGPAIGLKGFIEGKLRTEHRTEQMPAAHALRSPWSVQKSVWFALLMRDLRARFGVHPFGYLWIILEPGGQVAVLCAAYLLLRTKHTLYDTPLPVFLVMGVVPWYMVRSVMRKCINAIDADRALFDYRQVRPLDVLFVAWLEESLMYSAVYVAALVLAAWCGLKVRIDDPGALLSVFLALYVLSLGCGVLIAVVCQLRPAMRPFFKYFLRLLHFMSGVFYTMTMIPASLLSYLTWNPILHGLDLIKAASVGQYHSPASWMYLWLCASGSLVLGLILYRRNLVRILQG